MTADRAAPGQTPEDLRALGYFLLPLPPRRKEPPPAGWGEASDPYALSKDGNVGIRIRGGGGFVVLITNDGIAEANAAARWGTSNVTTYRGAHRYFRLPPGTVVRNLPNIRTQLGEMELHTGWGADGEVAPKYAVVPPSVHPSGASYAWTNGGIPAPADLPLLDMRILRLWEAPNSSSKDEMKVALPWPPTRGNIDAWACRIGTRMASDGATAEAIVSRYREVFPATQDWRKLRLTAEDCFRKFGGRAPTPSPPSPEGAAAETQNRVYADEFHDRHGEDFRYVRGEWLRWNESWWEPDAAYAAEKAMTKIVREAKGPSANAVEGSLKLAGWHHAVRPEDVDREPCLLACRGTTIDLRTGETRKPSRLDLITKGVDMAYDPAAPREEWTQFVTWAACGDPQLEKWFQEFAGYCLTGDTEERIFTIHCGMGNNGKGVFFETLTQILGPLAMVIHVGDLMENPMGTDAQNRTFADLAGVRLAIASESKEGARLNGALIKKATGGGETALARQLYSKSFQYRPEFKLVLQTNFRPKITNIDAAFKRRVRLVPWDNCVPEWQEDRRLKEKLQRNWSGILAWAVEGAVRYFARGSLPECRAIEEATAEYFAAEDWLKEFLDAYCDVDLTSATYSVRAKDLAKVFGSWVDETGGDPKRKRSPRAIAGMLKSRGFWSSTSNGTIWHGLRLSAAGELLLNPSQRRLDGG